MTPAEWNEYKQTVMSEKEKLHDEIQSLSARLAVSEYHRERADANTANLNRQVDELLLEITELRSELAAWRASPHDSHRRTNSDPFRIGAWGMGKDE